MATLSIQPVPLPTQQSPQSLPEGAAVLITPSVQPPFTAIRTLFDHLRSNPAAAASLNATYPKRGIFKSAALTNKLSDQKFTIDLSPTRTSLIPATLRSSLAPHGLEEVTSFFKSVVDNHVSDILSSLSQIAGVDISPLHATKNINFRLCDYNPSTAAPLSENGCGEHTDYGTFSIIFQDGQAGLELQDPLCPTTWHEIPGDATIILAGWCGYILSGGRVCAVRHRVRRMPGVRRLSAVLFVAPDLEVTLKPLVESDVRFSKEVMGGKVRVGWFKDVMGKRWRWREGNLEVEEGEGVVQDEEVGRLVFG
ncbi:hypothetical protein TWF481_001226 [Arthrobotrys musiformis]|uniref:Isopenicillin N synthase-like Fe(2+) 2OG dioxygenase domain-containing protein n=1 Tax=Arthrobotrys musiformis TaxID=47236 RepID=A0AAV9WRL5_9PEZI